MELRISSVCWLVAVSAAGPFTFDGEGTTDPSGACCGLTFRGFAFSNNVHIPVTANKPECDQSLVPFF